MLSAAGRQTARGQASRAAPTPLASGEVGPCSGSWRGSWSPAECRWGGGSGTPAGPWWRWQGWRWWRWRCRQRCRSPRGGRCSRPCSCHWRWLGRGFLPKSHGSRVSMERAGVGAAKSLHELPACSRPWEWNKGDAPSQARFRPAPRPPPLLGHVSASGTSAPRGHGGVVGSGVGGLSRATPLGGPRRRKTPPARGPPAATPVGAPRRAGGSGHGRRAGTRTRTRAPLPRPTAAPRDPPAPAGTVAGDARRRSRLTAGHQGEPPPVSHGAPQTLSGTDQLLQPLFSLPGLE